MHAVRPRTLFVHTQEEKLPLHHAAAMGAPIEVLELLRDAYPKATISPDKVSPHCMLHAPSACVLSPHPEASLSRRLRPPRPPTSVTVTRELL